MLQLILKLAFWLVVFTAARLIWRQYGVIGGLPFIVVALLLYGYWEGWIFDREFKSKFGKTPEQAADDGTLVFEPSNSDSLGG